MGEYLVHNGYYNESQICDTLEEAQETCREMLLQNQEDEAEEPVEIYQHIGTAYGEVAIKIAWDEEDDDATTK